MGVEVVRKLVNNIENVIVGKSTQINQILACWLAGGHVLLEDVPGTGKTMLFRALAKSVKVKFNRIQFTPDLLPSDITGNSIYNRGTGKFEFRAGPLFTTLLLGDELNRATPRTQSALLQAMAEKEVSADGFTYRLSELFLMMATQNPVEQAGTFALPEAQLDRFMIKLSMGYPTSSEEIKILKNQKNANPIDSLSSVTTEEEFLSLRKEVEGVMVADEIYKYISDIVAQSREHEWIELAASPRASLDLLRFSQAWAYLQGSSFVRSKDVYDNVPLVLSHRMAINYESQMANKKMEEVIRDILGRVIVPVDPIRRAS